MNLEDHLAHERNVDITVCPQRIAESVLKAFHIGDRVRMKPGCTYCPILAGVYGTLTHVFCEPSGARLSRPFEVRWDVSGLDLTARALIGDQAQIIAHLIDPNYPLLNVDYWMHPRHLHITKHNPAGASVSASRAHYNRWLKYGVDAKQ